MGKRAIQGLLLLVLAGAALPVVAFAVEAVLGDPRNLILPVHLLLMAAVGAAAARFTARSRRAVLVGALASIVAALLADLAWLLAIAG